MRICVPFIVLCFGFGAGSILCAQEQGVSNAALSSRRMADGKEWTTRNLNVKTDASYCYGDVEENCRKYGRLYTWKSAQAVCPLLGSGWRLPTDDEWRLLARQYGSVYDDSAGSGKTVYAALLIGGNSGFDAVLSGGRDGEGQYARLDAHGFYWTASENNADAAPYYNFAKGSGALYRQSDGEKERGFAVRCIRD